MRDSMSAWKAPEKLQPAAPEAEPASRQPTEQAQVRWCRARSCRVWIPAAPEAGAELGADSLMVRRRCGGSACEFPCQPLPLGE